MKHQALHLPCWSVFVPALFPIAVSQLLSFMLACSRVREQLQNQSPGLGIPEVVLVRGLRLWLVLRVFLFWGGVRGVDSRIVVLPRPHVKQV